MRGTIRLVILTCGLLSLTGGAARAQESGTSACEAACREEEGRCTDACSEQGDPIECEAGCRDTAVDCIEGCRE
jgi:hypothetical protein